MTRPVPLPPRLVLFDGVCGFCDRAVRWLLERDRFDRLRFAPLQGETASILRSRHPEIPEDTETLVYVETEEGAERVFLRSEAVFRVMAQLPVPWRLVGWLRWIPRQIADSCYRLFARHRYRLFGRLDACAAPRPGERTRFVD
jgi:predicted DCC family thiol-disulfide oxidoreductase YuxK